MQDLYDWITKVIILILLGTILEMLIPENSMKKYVHFIFGLIYLLMLAQPIFYLFQTDITEQVKRMENVIFSDEEDKGDLKKNIEKQKEDIQAKQTAYIWSELAQDYKRIAEDELRFSHDIYLKDVEFNTEEEIVVTLVDNDEPNTAITIEKIKIKDKADNKQLKDEKEIENRLRTIWQLDNQVTVTLQWEEDFIDQ